MIGKHSRFNGIVLAATSVFSVACLDDVLTSRAPEYEEPIQLVNPMLKALDTDQFGVHIGALLIRGTPSDTAFRPLESARIAVTVTTDRGDYESLLTGPYICAVDDVRTRYCNEISIAMDGDADLEQLAIRLDSIDARFISIPYPSAGRVLFLDENADSYIEVVKQWPGVKDAKYVFAEINVNMAVLDRWIRSNDMRGGSLLAFDEPIVADGKVQVLAGDLLRVEYVQPDGSVLRTDITVKCPEPDSNRLGVPLPIMSRCR
jgi:hypothetical protein